MQKTSNHIQNIRPQRLAHMQELLRAEKLDALVLNAGPSLVYLSGLSFHLSERPVVAFFTAAGRVCWALPELEVGKVEALEEAGECFPYGEDTQTWAAVFEQAIHSLKLEPGAALGIEPRRLRVLEYQLLQAAAPQARFLGADAVIDELRACKDEYELACLRKAVQIAQKSLQAVLSYIHLGVSEHEVAAELTVQMLKRGADPELPFQPSIAFGSNSANPHSVVSERRLMYGDLVLCDWGVSYGGYIADLTRVFSVGTVDAELKRVAEIVAEANQAALDLAAPGVSASEVDQAARHVIESHGYGRYFNHRCGHGLGLDVHEAPYLRAGNPSILKEGMVFTIEPGIYLYGRGGVRIEDDCFLTANGCETFSTLPRELIPLL